MSVFIDEKKERALIKYIFDSRKVQDFEQIKNKPFLLSNSNYGELLQALINYVSKFGSVPKEKSFIEWLKTDTKKKGIIDLYAECMSERNDYDLEFLIGTLTECYAARFLRDNNEEVEESFGKIGSIELLEKRMLNTSIELQRVRKQEVKVQEVWEGADDRWKTYQITERKDYKLKGIPFKIGLIDKPTGGCCPGSFILVYGQSGSGKTTLIDVNLPLNICLPNDEPVLIFSKEVPLDRLGTSFDSRLTLIDSLLIRDGLLSGKMRDKLKDVLQKQKKRKDKIVIVDVFAGSLNRSLVRSHLEIFKDKYGKYPVYCAVDSLDLFINEIPKVDAEDHSRKKFGSEWLFNLSRELDICIATSDQESRTGMIHKRKKIRRGQEVVKGSHGVIPNTTDAFLLDVPDGEEALSKLNIFCTKGRYGPLTEGTIYYLKEFSYMGENSLYTVENNKEEEGEEET